MVETDVINHLIDIEREAADVLFDAQEKAEAMVTAAKGQAEADFKAGYDAAVKECESNFKKNCGQISDEYKGLMQEFETKIKSAPKDISAFNSILDSLLFGK